MWNIIGTRSAPDRFESFDPIEVLYEFDGPRIFTVSDSEGGLNLAYWSDEDDRIARYVVVPTTRTIVDSLHSGAITVFQALNQPCCWLCDVAHDGTLVDCRRTEFDDIPRDALPAVDALLLPSLQPPGTERADDRQSRKGHRSRTVGS